MNEGCGAGNEVDISGGAALSDDAAHDPFSDDKNGAVVEAVTDDEASADEVVAGVGGKE